MSDGIAGVSSAWRRDLEAAAQRMGKRAVDCLPAAGGSEALDRLREQIVAELLAEHRRDVERARELCASAEAPDELDAIAGALLRDLRASVARRARSFPRLSFSATVDSWMRTEAPERMDDPSLDERRRTAALSGLDLANRMSGAYVRFFEAIEPLLGEPPGGSASAPSLLDVASGHGGFAVALAILAGRSRPLRIIASDLRTEYLALGRRRAAALGIAGVEFRRADALRLEETFGPAAMDIVTCTMALHHFTPGRALVLLSQAMRCARRGVVVIDLARNPRSLPAASLALLLGGRDLGHDAVVSIRRAYTAGELRLLSRLVPGGDRLEVFGITGMFLGIRSTPTGGEPC